MEIISGKIQKALKVVVYGPEGIGKSTFASHFPKPVFIDTEGSTNGMDVDRTQKPTSWELLNSYVKEIAGSKKYRTIVIDTIDWAEQLCINSICDKHNKTGIEDFGYGNGYVYEREEFGRFLNLLQEVVDSGINVVLTAHAQIKKFEQPEEMGAYDRWELKLGKKTGSQISPLVKEWADMVLFANYKIHSVAVDKDGKKHKAQGGKRVMYTTHNPCWDAKNRQNLPDEMDFDYSGIAFLFENAENTQVRQPVTTALKKPEPRRIILEEELPKENIKETIGDLKDYEPVEKRLVIPDDIPPELADLMKQYKVDEKEIRQVVSDEGFCPVDMPISNYPPDFIAGCLVAQWQDVYKKVEELRVPF